MRKKRNNYVDNVKFYEEISKYVYAYREAKEKEEPLPRINNYLGTTILRIAEGFAERPNFSGYSYKQEMIDDAVENCIKYLHLFDPAKSKNPFSYYTKFCYYAFIRRIKAEHKEAYIKVKLLEQASTIGYAEAMTKEEHASYADFIQLDPEKVQKLYDEFEKPKVKEPIVGIEDFIE